MPRKNNTAPPGMFDPGDLRDDGTFNFHKWVGGSTPRGACMTTDEACHYLNVTKADLTNAASRNIVRRIGTDRFDTTSIVSHLPGAAVCSAEQAMYVLNRSRWWLTQHAVRYGITNDTIGLKARYSRDDINRVAKLTRRQDRARARDRAGRQ